MDQDECNDIYAYVKNIEPWDCKIMIDGTDIAPLLTAYDDHERFLVKHDKHPKTTRCCFDPNKHKGLEAQNALVVALKRECHFSSCFHLSTERTEMNNNRLPHNWLCHVKLYCTHSRLSQASEKEFEDGKSSQSGTRQQLVKQRKKRSLGYQTAVVGMEPHCRTIGDVVFA